MFLSEKFKEEINEVKKKYKLTNQYIYDLYYMSSDDNKVSESSIQKITSAAINVMKKKTVEEILVSIKKAACYSQSKLAENLKKDENKIKHLQNEFNSELEKIKNLAE